LYRGINDYEKGYQPRHNIVKEEEGDLVANSHSILARKRKYFSIISICFKLRLLGRQIYTKKNH
jgi:hypothetical protein